VSRLREFLGDLGPNGRRGLIAGGVAALVLGLALMLGPVVRWQVGKRAAARGLVVQVETVRLGWGGVWLRDVRVRSSRSAALDATLSHVWVPIRGAVTAHGGEVRLRGASDEVERALRSDAQKTSAAATTSRRGLSADGLSLVWEGRPDGTEVRGWGLSFLREVGSERVGADLLRVTRPGFGLSVRQVSAVFSARTGRVLTSATGARADVRVTLDELRASTPSGVTGGAAPPVAVGAPAPPVVAGGPTPNVAAWVALARAAAVRALPEGAGARLSELRVDVAFGGERLGFGPSALEAKRHAGEVTVSLTPTEAGALGATPLSLRGRLPLLVGEPSLEVEGGPVPLAVLGINDGQLGLTHTRDATLEAHLSLTLASGGAAVRASGSGRVQNLSIHRPALSAREIRGLRLGFRGAGDLSFDGSRFALDDVEVTVGDVKLAGSLELTKGGAARRLRSKGGVPLASCASLLSSLPAALTTELGGLELEGTFSLAYDVDIDAAKLDKAHVKLDVKNDCRVKKVPRELSAARFRAIWTREVKAPDGTTMQIQTGPGAPNWVPYGQIPRFMEIAVLVCEDGGFYRHRGFDFRAIEKAIRADVEAGRFVRGASTISMQLAKNLYLRSEKTLARKIQEAFFTMVLEQELSKQELMELYLNVVELGPGIYGIQAAADYYFASDASSLTLAQALYLASILPDPTRQHFQPDGSVKKGWADYLKKLMTIARSVDRITDEELAAGLEEEIAFRKPGAVSVQAGFDAETPLDDPAPADFPAGIGP
jgi:hypothetical protein